MILFAEFYMFLFLKGDTVKKKKIFSSPSYLIWAHKGLNVGFDSINIGI